MPSRAETEYRYEKLTWPEINDAVDLGQVCIIPVGAVEQHGPHLPLDVDLVCPGGVAHGAGQEMTDKILVLPGVNNSRSYVVIEEVKETSLLPILGKA